MRDYKNAKRRLLVLGYNSTLTTAVEAPRQPKNHYDQIKVGGFKFPKPWVESCCGTRCNDVYMSDSLHSTEKH